MDIQSHNPTTSRTLAQLIASAILSTVSLLVAGRYARITFRTTGSTRPMLIIVGLLFLCGVGGFLLSLLAGKRGWAWGLWVGIALAALVGGVFAAMH